MRRAAAASWEFIVGDDPLTALGTVLTVAVVAALASAGVAAWWLLPLGVLVTLAISLRRARQRDSEQQAKRRGSTDAQSPSGRRA